MIKKRKIKIQKNLSLILCLGLLFIAGCESSKNQDGLASQLAAIRLENESMKNDIEELKRKDRVDELVQSFNKIAYLTPGSNGYSPVQFDLGYITIQFADVKPYANGSKVTLKFGNVLAASINGLKAKIEWGKVDDKGTPINDSAKTRDVTFSETLNSGSWTQVTLVLDGVPPTELGFVRIRDIAHNGIQLTNR